MRQRKKTEMYPLVKSWQQSGQSKLAFSQAHGLKPHTFHYWVKKYEQEATKKLLSDNNSKFIPLAIAEFTEQKTSKSQLALTYPNGVRLELSAPINIEYLSTLIKLGGNV